MTFQPETSYKNILEFKGHPLSGPATSLDRDRFGDEAFACTGFNNWKKAKERFMEHRRKAFKWNVRLQSANKHFGYSHS